MLNRLVKIVGGDPNKRTLEQLSKIVDQINALEPTFESLSNEALRDKTEEFRHRLAQGETLDDLLPEAFACVREASKRTLGLRHYDVQLMGGIVLHQGKIAEMRTGEGKTLVATLPLYLNALTGRGVHLVTVNDYLARRDARWMAPIYDLLGLKVGVLQMAARTDNGKKAFIVDLNRSSPHEDQRYLRMVPRREAYLADITYGTNSEFGFDYLRDNMAMRMADRVQRGHFYAIVDEVDNVLIDEARTPLIISGPAHEDTEWYYRMAQVVKALRPEDYEVSEKDRTVSLTEIGEAHVEELLQMPLRDPDRPEDLTQEQARLLGYLEQALRAQFLFQRNKDYLVQNRKVIIIDEFTGRMMPGRRWSDGLHQAVEAKEGVPVQSESVTYATITIQNYFRMYEKLAGMSGTALTEAEEFDKIYKLDVVAIPTNLEYLAQKPESGLKLVETRDEHGYRLEYYTRKDDPHETPLFWRRQDFPDVVYRTLEAKLRAICREILRYHALGRPVLVGTTSVESSERLSDRLRAEPLRRLAQTLLLRYGYLEKFRLPEDGRQIPELAFLYAAPLADLDLNAMRKLAREVGLSLNPEDPQNLSRLLEILELPPESGERLLNALRGGISHQVLNARKHTEESQIIAGAGAFGMVTIATNMAGRGVDIKLGGELAEDILAAVNRVLRRAGYPDPYDMNHTQRRDALLQLDPSAYGIYEDQVRSFLHYVERMEQVRYLGGLHVIGSERHEARRIDNQLRGRAARQGDPGSSRFYLSMEDDLMRLFGGQQVEGLMQRLKIDEETPLEMGLVSRLIEQSQARVEGYNFDMRKHLLEYDDVLNTQRSRIYAQRDLILTKEDLTEDVTALLRAELAERLPLAFKDAGGPWKLLAWLEAVQPPLSLAEGWFPSFTLRLLMDNLLQQLNVPLNGEELRASLLDLAQKAFAAEEEHYLQAIRESLEAARNRFTDQLEERLETIEIFFDSIEDEEEEHPRSPQTLQQDLSSLARMPLKFSPEERRLWSEDPRALKPTVQRQIEQGLRAQIIQQAIGHVERRLGEEIGLTPAQFADNPWEEITEILFGAAKGVFERRRQRYFGPEGQIVRDLESALQRHFSEKSTDHQPQSEEKIKQILLDLLIRLPQGTQAQFDRKTHRRYFQQTRRLNYVYYAAALLEDRKADQVIAQILDHLEEAQQTMSQALGKEEFSRLQNVSLFQLEGDLRRRLFELTGLNEQSEAAYLPLNALPEECKPLIEKELGRRMVTGIYRQLLLSVITEHWVEYLTQMEALRISIGLESYAQRDPLVQYKSRAAELYQQLQQQIRQTVIERMFTYRPRNLSELQTKLARYQSRAPDGEILGEEDETLTAEEGIGLPYPTAIGVAPESAKNTVGSGQSSSQNKKRRRRRR